MGLEKMGQAKEFDRLLGAILDQFGRMFGKCYEGKGVYRYLAAKMGFVESDVIVDVMVENGLREDYPYPVLCLNATMVTGLPKEREAEIRKKINDLNTAIASGAFPAIGYLGVYQPKHQVYLSYRIPFHASKDAYEMELENISYLIAMFYDELDSLMDLVLFACEVEGEMSAKRFCAYIRNEIHVKSLAEQGEELDQRLKDLEDEIRAMNLFTIDSV